MRGLGDTSPRVGGSSGTSKTVLVLATAALLIMIAVLRMISSMDEIIRLAPVLPVAASAERIDFGSVPLHGSAIREFVLRNDGEGPLHAYLSTSGPGYSISPEELVLYPGIEVRVSVAVTADQPGRFDDELLIQFEEGQFAPMVIFLAWQADSAPRERPGSEMWRARAGPRESRVTGSAGVGYRG